MYILTKSVTPVLGKCHLWILLPQLIAVTLAMTNTVPDLILNKQRVT